MSIIEIIKKELTEWKIVLESKQPGVIAHEMMKELGMESFKDD